MPKDAMPLYSSRARWKRKARRIVSFILYGQSHNKVINTLKFSPGIFLNVNGLKVREAWTLRLECQGWLSANKGWSVMTQDEQWLQKYGDVKDFIVTYKRNPSKHIPEERGKYVNWLRHNKKLFNSGKLKAERVEKFKELLSLTQRYRRKNQYE